MPSSFARHVPDLIIFCAGFAGAAILAWLAWRTATVRRSRWRRALVVFSWSLAALSITAGVVLTVDSLRMLAPTAPAFWLRGLAFVIAACATATIPIAVFWRHLPKARPQFDPDRRRVLAVVRTATLAAPAAVTAFAIIRRNELALREVAVPIPSLPDDLDGLRIAQLSDIHLSPFLSHSELERAIAMANETRPHLAVVTGDLITDHRDPLDDCLRALVKLRSDAGTLGCLGNHEVYAGAEDYAAGRGAQLGIAFLRTRAVQLRFGEAYLNVAGVDYQRFRKPYLVDGPRLFHPLMTNLLLSHNPDVFPTAAEQGWDLTLAGHTHGGQVNFEILSASVNIMRFYTRFTYGLYTDGPSSAFVTRGIGTVGLPARLGAPPEVALIRLVKA